ncbi:MAG: acyl carrier protein [Leptolyngbya sp. SIO1E4]|nr:acyl carrier protein [Leptolyngbya sp. SIO1E4]
MDIQEVMDVLKAILVDLGISAESLHEETLLYKDLQLDSTETVEVSLGLKRRLGVSVKLESRQDMTLIQVCGLIEAAVATSSQ